MYDEYGFPEEFSQIIGPDDDFAAEKSAGLVGAENAGEPRVPMRQSFPEAGLATLGGTSDGWEFRTVFGGTKLHVSYEMLKQFLREEGYGDVPLPETADDLRLFRKPRPGQLQLFGERGYIHNPIKILFTTDKKLRNALILCVFNEKSPGHLLRFHGLAEKPKPTS